MSDEQLDILDRESRLFVCWQAAVNLMSPAEDVRGSANTQELLDYLTEEYSKVRRQMRLTMQATREGRP